MKFSLGFSPLIDILPAEFTIVMVSCNSHLLCDIVLVTAEFTIVMVSCDSHLLCDILLVTAEFTIVHPR